jgi:phospholipid transport system substrate-binding protein
MRQAHLDGCNLIGRRKLLGLATGALLAAPTTGWSASLPDAALPVQRLEDALLAAMKAGRQTPFSQRYATLDPVVAQTFDLDTVLQASIGLRWDNLTPEQKRQLSNAFRRYTVSSYTGNFDSYSGQTFRITPDLRNVGARVIVQSYIVPADGTPKELSYVMRQDLSGWKAVDVLADGSISRVAVQRSDFRGLLDSGGAPALVAGLERKVSNLTNGAPA